jgi:prepilin-type N-terminal cleavage/methylation domain-containing protein
VGRNRRRGVTLIELLLTIVVLLIALGAIMGILTASVVQHRKNESHRIAVDAASTKIEDLRRTPIAALASGTFTVDGLSNSSGAVGTVTVAPTSSATMKHVTVSVVWDHPGFGSVTLDTLFNQ